MLVIYCLMTSRCTHQRAASSYSSCRRVCSGGPPVDRINDGVQDRREGIADPDVHRILADGCLGRTYNTHRKSHAFQQA